MVASKSVILESAERLTHQEANRLAELAVATSAQKIIIDLSRCLDASTAAFARLVILRRDLLQIGRDVWLAGMQDRPALLFEVHRLEGILPRLSDCPTAPMAKKISRPLAGITALAAAG